MPEFIFHQDFEKNLLNFIHHSLSEDIGEGDHTTLSTINKSMVGKAKLLVKSDGIIAGVAVASRIFNVYDNGLKINIFIDDGQKVNYGDIAFVVEGSVASILSTERLVLNIMQRLSGIATQTAFLVEKLKPYGTKLLDTRKTTPGLRFLEKWAVTLGGGYNHRIGLYDMILIKDNHIDAAGSITKAVALAQKYLSDNNLHLKIEVEARNFNEIEELLSLQGIDRVLLDNFVPDDLHKAVLMLNKKIETEASGKINETNIVDFAKTGVDYISSGSLTHSVVPLDLSLKIIKES